MNSDPRDPDKPDDAKEGWEGLSEEAEGTLAPSDELEAALREASEAVDVRVASKARRASVAGSADKLTIEALSNELQSLKETTEAKDGEIEELNDRFLRIQAEFENFRRRGLKERQEALQYGHQNLVKDLLTAVDNLERAIDHSEDSGDEGFRGLLQGVELVLRELIGVLERHGVSVIETEGKSFDPAVHEAMAQVPDDSVPPNSVVEVLQKGYLLRDRMLRPARVVVSKNSDSADG